MNPVALVFDEQSLTPAAQPWLDLLQKGRLPPRSLSDDPLSFMTQNEWVALLEDALRAGRGDHGYAWLQLGVMYFGAEQYDLAQRAWEKALELEPSAIVYRNLAVLAQEQQRFAEAADLYTKACAFEPVSWYMAAETCQALLQVERHQAVLDLLARLPPAVASVSRLQISKAAALLGLDDLDAVAAILDTIELSDVREGEAKLTDIWFEMHARRIAKAEGIAIDDALRQRVQRDYPPPHRIDFRMSIHFVTGNWAAPKAKE
jgi:tetratricopeptide (TPR) repeat protein